MMWYKVLAETLAVTALYFLIFQNLDGISRFIQPWLLLVLLSLAVWLVGPRLEKRRRGGRT